MNLLAQNKFRTKIMQHLLHQSSTEQQNSLEKQQSPSKDQKNIDNINQNFSKSMFFDKVSKQKPLISEDQLTQRQRNKTSNKQKSSNLTRFKENHTKNPQNNNKTKNFCQISNQKINQNMPDIKIKGHLKKQSYTFHQKLPIMQVSKMQGSIVFQKQKKNNKIKQQNQNKQNISQNSNAKTNLENQKERKYRFVVANKVTEALNLKKTVRENNQKLPEEDINQTEIKKQVQNEVIQFNETKRSKGSKQMLDFLQSARERLFQNMNKTDNENNVYSEKQTDEQKQENMKDNQKQIGIQRVNGGENHNFKIEIEVSENKTIQIELTFESDAKKVAKNFIQLNKAEFSSFSQLQIKKLEKLLSNKINLQVQKQRKLLELRKEKGSHEKYRNIIDHVGVNEVLLRNIESGEKTVKSMTQRKMSSSKNKKLQFSHVYLENIDLPAVNEQDSCLSYRKHFISQQQAAKIQKFVSFNPQNQQCIMNDSELKSIQLGGYLNSPHQLITYRPSTSQIQTTNKKQPLQVPYQQKQINISHFPLSSQICENSNRNNIQHNPQKVENQNQINNDQNTSQQIGAVKILSKSRSKLSKKRSLQQFKTYQNHQSNQQILSSNEQTKIPLSKHQYQNKNIKQQSDAIKSHPSINTISSQIVAKLGKQNIMNSLKEKQINKRQKILKQRELKIIKQMKQCSFKPKINNLSKSIDLNKKKKVKIIDILQNDTLGQKFENKINQSNNLLTDNQQNQYKKNSSFDRILSKLQKPQQRFQELYENHKTIQLKKQQIRQKSLQQISFKPQINKISKKIIETKRTSLNNSICQEYHTLSNSSQSFNRHQSTCKKPSKRNSVQFLNQTYNQNHQFKDLTRKRKSLNMSRNVQGLQIGEYLYKQAIKMKKKKESQQLGKVENFKPLDKSEKIMQNLRQRKLSQYFDELIGIQTSQNVDKQNYDFVISPDSFELSEQKFSRCPLKYLVPLLQQLRELEVSLNREEFIKSGMKLISYLSQDQKAQFLGMKKSQSREMQRPVGEPCLNKLSLELIEMRQDYVQDIYHRGLQYKRQLKQKIENDMENKVRKQLQKCTFKPQINMSQYRSSR